MLSFTVSCHSRLAPSTYVADRPATPPTHARLTWKGTSSIHPTAAWWRLAKAVDPLQTQPRCPWPARRYTQPPRPGQGDQAHWSSKRRHSGVGGSRPVVWRAAAVPTSRWPGILFKQPQLQGRQPLLHRTTLWQHVTSRSRPVSSKQAAFSSRPLPAVHSRGPGTSNLLQLQRLASSTSGS